MALERTRREFLASVAGGAVAALPLRGLAAAKRPEKPNFVVIFTDDQGYQDVGCFGSPNISTPNLDRMAAEGMKFTDFYVAASVCTPSRAALLTGCYPQRVSLPSVLFPRSRVGLNPKEITIAELLKGRGYATMCIGKWHLGHLPPFLPTRHGFDHYFGIPYSNDMWIAAGMKFAPDAKLPPGVKPEDLKAGERKKNAVPLMRDEVVVEYPADQDTLTQRYTQEAIRFITENKDRPFFLYLPHTMPHVPLHCSGRFRGRSKRGLYGDVIEEIDWSVGEILKALKRLGIAERTCVVFTSDNGPWLSKGKAGGSALPLRGGKFTTYEGGMREPCIMWWPGQIPAGKVCSEVAAAIDLLPTFARLAGTEPPSDRIIDGKDIWPLMSGQPGAKSPHEAFFYLAGYNVQAVRSGDWKLRATGPRRKGQKPRVELYNLREDISEKKNVAEAHPEIVERLMKLIERCQADIGRNGKNRRPCGRVQVKKG